MAEIIACWVILIVVGVAVIWLTIDTIIRIVNYYSNKTPKTKISDLTEENENSKEERKV